MPVTLDMIDDLNPASAVQMRTLLLAPPSLAAHEEKLRDLFTTYDRSVTDLQMLDRLSAGFVTLPPTTYDQVLVLTDTDGTRHAEALKLLNRDVYNALVPSMKPGSKLHFQDGHVNTADASEAILAGLVEKNGSFEKMAIEETSIPLKLGGKRKKAGLQNGLNSKPNGTHEVTINNNDDELIDEDTLLSETDMTKPLHQPRECEPNAAKKRRRPCKDCTCGLASKLEAEDQSRQAKADADLNILKLKSDDLNDEIDFTVKGKTGSCNSCSLGDAFRCDGCPYIGLPPFKPGEEVRIINDTVQL
ncbi:hypothetical protein PHISCL_05814 [Aspergillus sclerotialis]|uniref:Uncharacterized protein n=1 Tax=Aspergillus sclerotialis TaxID=2070753 RepID=A0A3A2ZHV1_9EURO|nr:hypothetical protein PHISCL_05814 [Aspergillus sclerotialis]